MAASTPPATIVYEPLIKSNYRAVLGHDVMVLTQLDIPYWLVVVVSCTANSTVRTVVTTEKSLDLSAALAAVHRRSALEVSHFYAAMGKTYNSPVLRSLPKQKRKTKCVDDSCYNPLDDEDEGDEDIHRLPDMADMEDDNEDENYTDSASESDDESELGLGLSDDSEDEEGLEHIKKPSYHRRHETRKTTAGAATKSKMPPPFPRMAPQTAVPPPAASPSSTATAPAGAASMAYRPHYLHCHHPASVTGVYPPTPLPPQPGHKTAAAVGPTIMPGIYPAAAATGHPINAFQPPKSNMPPPIPVPQQQHQQQQQQQLRANAFYPPSGGPVSYTKPKKLAPNAAPLLIPVHSSPAPRPVSINIHWLGRGSLMVTDNCAPLRRHVLDRAMQLARLKSGEFGGARPREDAGATGRWEHRMMALLKRVRAGDVVHEVTSRVDDLSPLLVGMGPPSKVGFPCFDVEIDLRSDDGDE